MPKSEASDYKIKEICKKIEVFISLTNDKDNRTVMGD
jgi:hypothetical protein